MPYKDKDKEKESKARYEAKRSGRTRNFATVVYPESAPEDWINKLEELHVAVLVSPLHDKDINPSGEPKKPHYHVLPQSNCVIFHQKKALECVLCFRGTFSCTNTLRGFIGFILHFPGCLYRPGTNVFGFLL